MNLYIIVWIICGLIAFVIRQAIDRYDSNRVEHQNRKSSSVFGDILLFLLLGPIAFLVIFIGLVLNLFLLIQPKKAEDAHKVDLTSEDAIEKLNELGKTGNKKICGVWKSHGINVLKSLPVIKDPEFCLDGVHEYYAHQANSMQLSKTVNKIYSYLMGQFSIVNATVSSISVSVSPILNITIQLRYSSGSYSGESLRIVRTNSNHYKGCISTNDAAYRFG